MPVKRRIGSNRAIVLIVLMVVVSLVFVACTSFSTPTGSTETPEPTVTGELTQSQRLGRRWIEVLLDEQERLSFLADGKDGNILDPTLGKPASAGCIRLTNSDELYQFIELGMKVIIH